MKLKENTLYIIFRIIENKEHVFIGTPQSLNPGTYYNAQVEKVFCRMKLVKIIKDPLDSFGDRTNSICYIRNVKELNITFKYLL
jgi:hypothetical protein